MSDLTADKATIRRQMIDRRDRLEPDTIHKADARGRELADLLISRCRVRTVGLYWPKGNEFPTGGCWRALSDGGVLTALPVVLGDVIEFFRFQAEGELSLGPFGVAIPPRDPARKVNPDELDAVVVPGVAFDRMRNRLGWGKGYYDRYLPLLRRDVPTVGLAYEFQILDRIPAAEGDWPVQHLFTEIGSTLEASIRVES